MISLTILGAPRTKKTSNRIYRPGKGNRGRIRVMPSKAWQSWCQNAVFTELDYEQERIDPVRKWNCRALFYRDRDIGDAVGYYQGLADLLEKRGVIPNDRQLVSWDGSRLLIDRQRPRVEIELAELDAMGQVLPQPWQRYVPIGQVDPDYLRDLEASRSDPRAK